MSGVEFKNTSKWQAESLFRNFFPSTEDEPTEAELASIVLPSPSLVPVMPSDLASNPDSDAMFTMGSVRATQDLWLQPSDSLRFGCPSLGHRLRRVDSYAITAQTTRIGDLKDNTHLILKEINGLLGG